MINSDLFINKSCLLVIDMQKGIFSLKQKVFNETQLVKNLKTAIAAARKNRNIIIFSQHENKSFLIRDSAGWEIIDELKPSGNDIIIHKKKPGVFTDTNLLALLHEAGITRIFIAGLISNGCIRESCLEAVKNNFKTILIKDAHSTFYKNAEKIIQNINEELKTAGATLLSSSDLLRIASISTSLTDELNKQE